jgi:hypothetical protein
METPTRTVGKPPAPPETLEKARALLRDGMKPKQVMARLEEAGLTLGLTKIYELRRNMGDAA